MKELHNVVRRNLAPLGRNVLADDEREKPFIQILSVSHAVRLANEISSRPDAVSIPIRGPHTGEEVASKIENSWRTVRLKGDLKAVEVGEAPVSSIQKFWVEPTVNHILYFRGITAQQSGAILEAGLETQIMLPQALSWGYAENLMILLCAMKEPVKLTVYRNIAAALGASLQEDQVIIDIPKSLKPSDAIKHRDGLAKICQTRYREVCKAAIWRLCDEFRAGQLVKALPAIINESQLVLWDSDLWNIALTNCEAFIGMKLTKEFIDTIPPMIWMFYKGQGDVNIGFKGVLELDRIPDYDTGAATVEAFIISPGFYYAEDEAAQAVEAITGARPSYLHSTRKVKSMTYGMAFTVLDPINPICGLPIFRFFGGFREEVEVTEDTCGIVALIEFMKLEIISKQETPPPRPERRRAEREKRKLPEVYTIYLRKKKKVGNGRAEPEYKLREGHAVSWHWKRQRYPSTGEVKRIMINTYWAGPEPEDEKTKKKAMQRKNENPNTVYKIAR